MDDRTIIEAVKDHKEWSAVTSVKSVDENVSGRSESSGRGIELRSTSLKKKTDSSVWRSGSLKDSTPQVERTLLATRPLCSNHVEIEMESRAHYEKRSGPSCSKYCMLPFLPMSGKGKTLEPKVCAMPNTPATRPN
eukprot:2072332-Pyramimonas_sp.AAC.1